jgi:quinol monooxygenase YgiN
MKTFLSIVIGAIALFSCTNSPKNSAGTPDCTYNKDSMVVVMRFERKVLPQNVALLKKSFDECKAEVMKKEPGCLDYSLFQSYHDSTVFLLTETWATKGAHNAHMEMEHTKKHISEIQGIEDPSFKPTSNYMYWICPGANEKITE